MRRELWANRARQSCYSLWLLKRHRPISRTRMRLVEHRNRMTGMNNIPLSALSPAPIPAQE